MGAHSQIRLLHSSSASSLPTDCGRYVPALQNKPGELDALKEVSDETWERITPLIHFVGPAAKDRQLRSTTIREWVKKVDSATKGHTVYLDVARLKPTRKVIGSKEGTVPALEEIFRYARKRGMNFVPIAWADQSAKAHRNLVADAVSADARGVAVRYRLRKVALPPGTSQSDYLSSLLETLGCEPSNADLLLDLEYIDPDHEVAADDIASWLREVPGIEEWRSLVLLGSSMPKALGCIPEQSVGSLPRAEWAIWEELRNMKLPRLPAFGDYAVQNPHPPTEKTGPGQRANIRYTAETETVIARGLAILQEGAAQYQQLCEQLTNRPEFAGPTYSWGDKVIDDCAKGRVPPGAQRMWRGAGTSHHLRYVTEQLRKAA